VVEVERVGPEGVLDPGLRQPLRRLIRQQYFTRLAKFIERGKEHPVVERAAAEGTIKAGNDEPVHSARRP